MTKEITKAFILQQLEDRFGLRELVPETFAFSEMVVPTYNIEQHLKTWEVKQGLKSITGTGGFTLFTVPPTERWTIRAYQTIFYGAGAYTIAGVYVGRPTSGKFIYLDLEAARSTSYLVNLPIPVVVNPGSVINVNVDGYTSTQNIGVDLDVIVEALR